MDWGDVPTWVASIGTAGTLGITSWLLLRDRRKDERSQAAQVTLTVDVRVEGIFDPGSGEREVILTVHNASDAPITYVRVEYTPLPEVWDSLLIDDDTKLYEDFDFTSPNAPLMTWGSRTIGARPLKGRDERAFKVKVPHKYASASIATHARLVFIDMSNMAWMREVATGKLWRTAISGARRPIAN